MSLYYTTDGCEGTITPHVCDPCGPIEQGRVRSVAFVHKDYVFTTYATAADWTTGINTGKIHLIPETSGSYDGGAPKEGPGFGDLEKRITGYSHSVTFKDPNFKSNRSFWNSIKDSRAFKMVMRTESQLLIGSAPVSIAVKAPVADDPTADVSWEITCTWNSQDLVQLSDIPAGIFDRCFQY